MISTPTSAHVPAKVMRSGHVVPTPKPSDVSSRPALPHASSSGSSIAFGSDDEVELVSMEGLTHSEIRLEARRYKTEQFAHRVRELIQELQIPSWLAYPDAEVKVAKVAGSLTNAVFFASAVLPSSGASDGKPPKTLLLRIYGPSSGALISRPRELRTLHLLSSVYRIGPRVYGTFENGRLEEFFDSAALTAHDLRDPTVSRWIGMRMAELHSVDVDVVEDAVRAPADEGVSWDVAARRNVREWLGPAREVLALPAVSPALRATFELDEFAALWARYSAWLAAFEDKHGKSPRVFSHNDTQYGNLLRLNKLKEGTPEHRQIIVVDFEYASPNAAAFDLANHFHEWTVDYHGPSPQQLQPSRYPTLLERYNLYAAYLSSTVPPLAAHHHATDADLANLDAHVRAWSPASHGMWAVWGLVQARDDLENPREGEPEFDYIGYAQCRFDLFREELRQLGI